MSAINLATRQLVWQVPVGTVKSRLSRALGRLRAALADKGGQQITVEYVRDGRALCAPAYEPVAKFPVRVEDGAVWTRDDRD